MKPLKLAITASALALLASTAQAGFHVMQIEQIIAGINGDSTAQAIQLRLRQAGQNFVGGTTLIARDALGGNAITLITIPASVANAAGGDNILLTTSAFNTQMSSIPGYAADFTLTAPIPASYLSGGKLTFQSGATIYWSVAFGAYTGTNTGDLTNDADGNFGAPTVALPNNSRQGIRFINAFSSPSTTNAADYALTANPATVRNNARNSFVVAPEPGTAALLAMGGLAGIAFIRRRRG